MDELALKAKRGFPVCNCPRKGGGKFKTHEEESRSAIVSGSRHFFQASQGKHRDAFTGAQVTRKKYFAISLLDFLVSMKIRKTGQRRAVVVTMDEFPLGQSFIQLSHRIERKLVRSRFELLL